MLRFVQPLSTVTDGDDVITVMICYLQLLVSVRSLSVAYSQYIETTDTFIIAYSNKIRKNLMQET